MFANAMEVFKLLDKSNCRKCNEATCLAFASKVFLGTRKLGDCPYLDPRVIAEYTDNPKGHRPGEAEYERELAALKQRLGGLDLTAAAPRTGGRVDRDRLVLRIFGKPFSVDNAGSFKSDIHINPWITGPVLTYVLESKGVPLTGEWVPFRELENARELNGLFVKRTEEPLKKIADAHPDLFEDLAVIFNGRQIEELYQADISMVLYPLPLVPMMICYWKKDDGMDSDLHLFFDKSASDNGGSDMVFRLTAGIVQMFEKLAKTHGWQAAAAAN
ncbi:MAG TPA: DUF3786 domain-containing protein [Desulfotignum sp.]|jgi:hypothetical protein|nr:DUF3786 domain-containing protein [Desulfotignum sp.]